MPYTLLAGGYRSSIAALAFDPAAGTLTKVSDAHTPINPSWLEHAPAKNTFYAVSEDETNGTVFSAVVNDDGVQVTSERKTHGGPCHVHVNKDGSGIVVANYVGGSVLHIPTNADGTLSTTSESPVLSLPFPYENSPKPNPARQDAPHAHQVLEGENGLLYVFDLGSDRIYHVIRQGESGLKVVDWNQCAPGFGPRHGVVSHDGKLLYVLGELGHAVTAFDIPSTHDYHPVFAPVGIIPPSVPEGYSGSMDAAEITLHPNDPRTLYVSNRLELDASKANPTLPPIQERQVGDAVAVLRLKANGKGVESVSFVRTNCDTIRAFQISADGKYAAVAGQQNELVEVYEIGGDKHDQWKLVAAAPVDRVTDFIWL
ncbi:putative 6-phosphogluconolactonase [Vanrija pseudolonga]|uniref:6-phosphogluconolactonase n=1 Tax=Vanrija pseudolonga TaxID=143232 RepID=A0AAF0YGK2_9TREE|nr:putative 6-phosphogluconolactonase [Vanrija pseudolonga]